MLVFFLSSHCLLQCSIYVLQGNWAEITNRVLSHRQIQTPFGGWFTIVWLKLTLCNQLWLVSCEFDPYWKWNCYDAMLENQILAQWDFSVGGAAQRDINRNWQNVLLLVTFTAGLDKNMLLVFIALLHCIWLDHYVGLST